MKRWQSLLLGVTVSAVTLIIALRGNDLSQLGNELERGRYFYVVPSLALMWVVLVIKGIRWRLLLDRKLEPGHSFHILNVGNFLNQVLPMRLGEIARGFLTTRLQPPISIFTSLSSIVVERLIDLLAVVALVAVAINIVPIPKELEAGAKVTGLLSLGGFVILLLFALKQSLVQQVMRRLESTLP